MCGIIGYTGNKNAATVLVDGLSKLEYRGYDSAGIAMTDARRLLCVKSVGRVAQLAVKLDGISAACGIGHTRWATNGEVSERNCHPILSRSGSWAVVHNGIIENAAHIKVRLSEIGYSFYSDTDTEVVAALLDYHHKGDVSPLSALKLACAQLVGSYALAVLCKDCPQSIFVARMKSPLAVGFFDGEVYVASDTNAIPSGGGVMILDDGQVLEVNTHCSYAHLDTTSGSDECASKCGYPHFMLKEIHQQPTALERTLCAPSPVLEKSDSVLIVACGSSYNAAKTVKPYFEKKGIQCDIEYASEYRYSFSVAASSLAVFVSQSGETADTLAAQEESKRRGQQTLGIVNVPSSALSRSCDYLLPTVAGAEIAVATTKGFTSQLAALYRLASILSGGVDDLGRLPQIAQDTLSLAPDAKKLADIISSASDVYFIGRGADYGVAMEGALKLKEISYIHAEAYAAGELKHGAISLIESGVPVIAIATNPLLYSKMLISIRTVKARGGYIAALTSSPDIAAEADFGILLPPSSDDFAPLSAVIVLQLLAYHAALNRNCDIDKPRNLAKSVTVE